MDRPDAHCADFIDAAIALAARRANVTDATDRGPAASLRGLRPRTVAALQGSHDALFAQDALLGPVGPSLGDRYRLAAGVCRDSGAETMAATYDAAAQAVEDRIPDNAARVCEARAAAFEALSAFAQALAVRPIEGGQAHVDRMLAAGLTPSDIVLAGQLIGFVACQVRVVAGVGAMLDVAAEPALAQAWDAVPPDGAGRRSAEPVADGAPAAMLNIRGFTDGPVRWRSWLPIVDLESATEDQRQVADESNYTANPEYFLLLAHQPEALRQRSKAMHAALYDPRGLSRAERELGAVVASRINGCVYCAAGHSRLVIQLQRRRDTIAQVFEDPIGAGRSDRERAVIAFAVGLTRDVGQLGVDAIRPLIAAGVSRLETLDLIQSVAMFAWANRLMLNLGEPILPPGYVAA